jgi:hypothetical protein
LKYICFDPGAKACHVLVQPLIYEVFAGPSVDSNGLLEDLRLVNSCFVVYFTSTTTAFRIMALWRVHTILLEGKCSLSHTDHIWITDHPCINITAITSCPTMSWDQFPTFTRETKMLFMGMYFITTSILLFIVIIIIELLNRYNNNRLCLFFFHSCMFCILFWNTFEWATFKVYLNT